MAGSCINCGKGPVAGRTYSRRGMLKKKGGVGRRTTRKNKRVFLPNLQSARILWHGEVMRAPVCAACLKNGRVVKAPTRVAPAAS